MDRYWFYFIYINCIKYDNILDEFEFERFKAKVKATVAIFRKKNCHRSSALIIIRFWYNFTKVSGMTIPWISLRFSMIGSRSLWLFLEKFCHHSSAFIYRPILILYHTNVGYDNTSNKFEFEHSRAKVKITVAIFRTKDIVIALVPHLWTNFDFLSYKSWIWQYLWQVRVWAF